MATLSACYYGGEEFILLQSNSGKGEDTLACLVEKTGGGDKCLGGLREWFWNERGLGREDRLQKQIEKLRESKKVLGLGGIYMEEEEFYYWGWGKVCLYGLNQKGDGGNCQTIDWGRAFEIGQSGIGQSGIGDLGIGRLDKETGLLLCSAHYGGEFCQKLVRESLWPGSIQKEKQMEKSLGEIAACNPGGGSAVYVMRKG